MGSTLEGHPLARPVTCCVVCGSDALEPVAETGGSEVHFLCRDCGRCWRVELGYVQRMAPNACAGCPHLAECELVYLADNP